MCIRDSCSSVNVAQLGVSTDNPKIYVKGYAVQRRPKPRGADLFDVVRERMCDEEVRTWCHVTVNIENSARLIGPGHDAIHDVILDAA